MRTTSQLKLRLTRQDWIDAALDMLIEAGIGAVSIDRLANTLGVTRGSFYHHFSDRSDLLRDLLDYWAQRWTYDVRDQIAILGLDASTTLLALMKAIRSNNAADFDAPFRAWALHDPVARAVVNQVDETRLAFIRSQFEAIGFEGLEAENRARLFLHYEAAAPAMFYDQTKEQDEALLVARHLFLTTKN
jgi:AcrR family transcriptional regulator